VLLLCGLQVAYKTWYEAGNQTTRGRALIIANSVFNAGFSERKGTYTDVRKLRDVFTWLNFEVEVHNNLTSEVRYIDLLIIY